MHSDETMKLYNKGKGRSLMLGDFLVCHPDNPFFQLSEYEWAAAIKKHPDLLQDDNTNCVSSSASGSLQVGVEGYFDNSATIEQFTRLFKLLPLEKTYQNHRINTTVDNSPTPSAREYSLSEFGMREETRCSVDVIEYTENNGVKQVLQCRFTEGEKKGKSKGLLLLPKELKINLPYKIKLAELKTLTSTSCIPKCMFFV